jgi:hypothetical protein
MTARIKSGLHAAAGEPDTDAAVAALSGIGNETLDEIALALAGDPDRFSFGEGEPEIVLRDGTPTELDRQTLYVLDLRETETFAVRSRKCAIVSDRVFADCKASTGGRPTLLVVEEAHNFIPERTTGFMAEATRHGSLGSLTTIAVEGRKFNLGLVVSSQRPSRLAKDVLAQMNSQLIFRMANLEDLAYVRESFEASGSAFLNDLPTLDRGVCLCAGTMIAMPTRCDMPLFAPTTTADLPSLGPGARVVLEAAVRNAVPQAEITRDDGAVVVYAGSRAEVTLTTGSGGATVEVACADPVLRDQIMAAVRDAAADAAADDLADA